MKMGEMHSVHLGDGKTESRLDNLLRGVSKGATF